MALTDDGGNNMVLPVTPMGNNGGFGGDWGSWLIVLLVFGMMFGGGFGGFGGFGGGMMNFDFPWLLNGQNGINANVNAGFNQAALQGSIGDLRSDVSSGFRDVQLGIAGVNQQLCNTGNGIIQSVNGGFANAEVAANARQIANMQQAFNAQIASMQGFNGVQTQTADVKATILSENCQDRYEAANNARDIMANATANTQAILNSNQRLMDKLCDQELQAERRENQNLRTQLNMATLNASQVAQTAQIKDGQNATMTALVNELRSCPIPSQPVYGSQPIFTCPNNGCGCNNYAFA